MLPIIDTHQHLWDLTRFNLPWLEGAAALKRSYVTSDYLAATKDANVIKAVYMEVDVAADQKDAEAEAIIALCEQDDNPTAGAVISGDPSAAEFDQYIRRYAASPYVKGVRQVLHGPELGPGYCLSDEFIAGVRLLGALGKSFDLCLRPAELGDAARLADACPDTQMILDHCGNGDPNVINGSVTPQADEEDVYLHTRTQWMEDISALAQRSNVVCKISGIVARVQPGWQAADLAPTVNHCLDAFGPDRVIFGGDWPVCTLGASYQEWASALRQIISVRSEIDQRKLLSANAEALYGLT